jgi:hypothetical protein
LLVSDRNSRISKNTFELWSLRKESLVPAGAASEDAEGGTVFEDGVMKIKGQATSSSIIKCYRNAKLFNTICNAGACITAGKGILDLAKLYNAVMECGGPYRVSCCQHCQYIIA